VLYAGAQQGHGDLWQICLAHQLRECTFANETGDIVFAPRMKRLLVRMVVLARDAKLWPKARAGLICVGWITNSMRFWRWHQPAETVGGCASVTAKCPAICLPSSNIRMRRQPDNNGSERELRPTATYRKVTGGFRSHWAADFIRRFAIGHRHCRTLRHRRIPRNSRCSQTGSR
jgi:transposase